MPLNTIPNEGLTSRGYPSDRLVTPIIINGDMSVAQRGTSVTSQTGSGYLTVDRVRLGTGANCTFTVTQASEAPTGQGFSKSYKLVATTGDATLANAEYNLLQYRCEGNTLQAIKKGTSNAEKITFAFWVKASVTGTYILELIDNDNSRYISKAYTISAADTWEKKIIVIDADTTGAFDNDSNKSLTIDFWLGAGNDYSSGTLQTAWTSNTSANRAVGQVNAFASNNDAWQITGLQIEVGEFDSTTIPSFPFESFDSNFMKCCRYFQQIGDGVYTDTSVGGNRLAIGQRDGSSSAGGYPTVPVLNQLRSTPSITHNNLNVRQDGSNKGISSIDTIKNFGMTVSFNLTADSNFSTGETFQIRTTGNDGYMRFDAEL